MIDPVRNYRILFAGIAVAVLSSVSPAGTIYVDSRLGNDGLDGRSETPLNRYTGPVRTLRRASQLLCPGDSIVLANNGTPYYGSLSFVGPRHSGVPSLPVQLIGNGATISGALPIPQHAWRPVELRVWSITPVRKTYAQVARGGETVPTYDLPWSLALLPNAPADHWYYQNGRIFLKTTSVDDPRLMPMELASEEVGLTLLNVEHVVIRDVTFRHFRLDGINAHDRCRSVLLDNVICEGNGRAGVAVGGTSDVTIRNSLLADNRRDSLLITELGQVQVEDSQLMREPTVVPLPGRSPQ